MHITALADLGRWLKNEHYSFVTVTPETHRRVNARAENAEARSLRDIFGWSRKFKAEVLGPTGMDLLARAGALQRHGDIYSSTVRFSTVGANLFAHSSFPCEGADSVFFGPDTYRYLRAIEAAAQERVPSRIIDIGGGSGAAGIRLAQIYPQASVTVSDVNDVALDFARANALLNGCSQVTFAKSDVLQDVSGDFDLIVSNPPYLVDAKDRLYRHGGGALGFDLSLRILSESLARLSRDGKLLLYTGCAILNGEDLFFNAAFEHLGKSGRTFTYEEIDPDVFGEELEKTPYAAADRLAVVLITVNAKH